MLVREVMTSPAVTVRSGTPVHEALVLLDQYAVTSLPVVTRSGVVVGVVSEADLIRESLPPDVRTQLIPSGDLGASLGPDTGRVVADVMSTCPLTVRPDCDLAEAAVLMTDTVAKSLPVVDELGRVVGMVSRRDVVHVLARPDSSMQGELNETLREVGTDWLATVNDGEAVIEGPEDEADGRLAITVACSIHGLRRARLADPV